LTPTPTPPRSALVIVVVAIGSAGIVAAVLATAFGLRVAAVERERVGGDFLSPRTALKAVRERTALKALLAAARAAHTMRRAGLRPAHRGASLREHGDPVVLWPRPERVRPGTRRGLN
jgi:pyruvate/2-oxoglutarate dehydrogenase complex dihydrolipoamide dehydrogenase (E3) component